MKECVSLDTIMQWFPTVFSSLPTFDVTDPQLPNKKLQYYRSLPQLYQSVRCKKKGLYVENIGEEQKKICTSAGSGTPGGLRVKPPAANEYLGFHIKNSHFSTLFIEKGLAVSAVTMDNAKIISRLMSTSRSLAKI